MVAAGGSTAVLYHAARRLSCTNTVPIPEVFGSEHGRTAEVLEVASLASRTLELTLAARGRRLIRDRGMGAPGLLPWAQMTDQQRITIFLAYLALTIGLETVVLFVVGRQFMGWTRAEVPSRFLVLAGITCSLTTYPYLWFVLPVILGDYVTTHVVGESIIILVEAVIMQGMLRVSWKHSLAASTACNGTTIVIGLMINRLELWRLLIL